MANNTVQVRLVTRHDTAANWTATNPILLEGEQGYETDTGYLKVGDGSSTWDALSYINKTAAAIASVSV